MKTEVLTIDSHEHNHDLFEKAAQVIQEGGLVAFPTETVYGLGANALEASAVKKIYQAKGRPSDNPLILHIARKEDVYQIACNVSETAERLMEAFWPGPLTLIFQKKEVVSAEVAGGLETVGVRFPQNRIAQQFIKHAAVPIAAPSANSSGKPSPTRASHVMYDLMGKVDIIIDGGSAELGLESTILDVSSEKVILLRPGSVTKEMIEAVVGIIELDESISKPIAEDAVPKAPGMKYTHYSPLAEITIFEGDIDRVVAAINAKIANQTQKVGVLATEQTKHAYPNADVLVVGDRQNPESIAANLFKMLRKFDYLGIEQVYSESFGEEELGMAIMNRLQKAAAYRIRKID